MMDHRDMAEDLDLFHFQEEAPGMVFWHPNGWELYRKVENAVREHLRPQGYKEVRSPQVLRKEIWEKSGHWGHFRQGMFLIGGEGPESAIKPVNCPGHIQILKKSLISYRDLPVRFAEFGCVHRNEPGGSLHGLMRLQQFNQDDGHIFCSEDQAKDEVLRFIQGVPLFYRKFGFQDISVALSLRPLDRAGSDYQWDMSESALREALVASGLPFKEQPGEGAFYGPKVEFSLRDSNGRDWQCGTIQFDMVMPENFDISYVAKDNSKKRVVMLHRALLGSLERFIGILLEHYGKDLPGWLCPQQVAIVPVSPEYYELADQVSAQLAGVSCIIDSRDESIPRRVACSAQAGIPACLVVGDKEKSSGNLAVRYRNGHRDNGPAQEVLQRLKDFLREPACL